MLLADELSLQQVNCTRGASGEMPCPFCMNVKSKRSLDLAHDTSGFFVSIAETDTSKFVLHSDATVRAIMRQLAEEAATCPTAKAFEESQRRCGFTHTMGSILTCPALVNVYLPITHTVYDWMHCVLIDGLFHITLSETMKLLKPLGVRYNEMGEYVKDWVWPKRVGGRSAVGRDLWRPKNYKKWYEDGRFKSSASEALSLYPLLAMFLFTEREKAPRRPEFAGVSCFLCICSVIDALQRVARGHCSPDRLAKELADFFTIFSLVFGAENWTPKFHFTSHLPRMLKEHGTLLACFVHERKHRESKRFAAGMTNTAVNFETSVLSELTCAHLYALEDSEFSLSPRVLGPELRLQPQVVESLRATFGTDAIRVGRRARYSLWGLCEVGDVALVKTPSGSVAGRISFAVEADDALHFGIALWAPAAGAPAEGKLRQWETSVVRNVVVEASCLLDILLWKVVGTVVQTLRPC